MYSLSKMQFDVLTSIEDAGVMPGVTEIADALSLNVDAVNNIITDLRALSLIGEKGITNEGYSALEPYRVKRAVILAAGFGARMIPITINTPKPLVRVNGVRIIDTLLDALAAAEIREVIIVRGYRSEQFDQLLYKYPYIKFIENPIYNESNNISSLMCARLHLQNTYICEADLLINNKSVIRKYQYCSNFLGVPVERTDDWCFTSHNGYITSLKIGGTNCHHVYGISYWTAEDGGKLSEHVKEVFEQPGGKERLWDLVPLQYHIEDYQISIRECRMEDISEIDTFNELKEIDPSYAR